MTDYSFAFEEGLKAAKEAKNVREEINSVFKQLNDQITETTGGKIVIERRKFEVRQPLLDTLYKMGHPRQKYFGIAASNPTISDGPIKELSKWSQDRRGYPCKITWADQERFCEDKKALEQTLAELLRDPSVGEDLYVLINLKTKKEQPNDTA